MSDMDDKFYCTNCDQYLTIRTLRAELEACQRERESQMIQLGGYLWAELAPTRVVDVEVVKEGIRRIIQEADNER